MLEGKAVREPKHGGRLQNGRGRPKALAVGVRRATHCEGRNGRSAGAPGGANRALMAAATANAPNAIKMVKVIGVLLLGRMSAGDIRDRHRRLSPSLARRWAGLRTPSRRAPPGPAK